MARGWESKSVEEQQAEAPKPSAPQNGLSKEEIEGRRKRDGLLLSRRNIQQQLSAATNGAYREMLEKALAHLDQQLAQDGKH